MHHTILDIFIDMPFEADNLRNYILVIFIEASYVLASFSRQHGDAARPQNRRAPTGTCAGMRDGLLRAGEHPETAGLLFHVERRLRVPVPVHHACEPAMQSAAAWPRQRVLGRRAVPDARRTADQQPACGS